MKTIKLLSLSLLAMLTFSACSSDDDSPEVIIEQEEITTLNVSLTAEGETQPLVFTFRDLDGDGSNVEQSSENLAPNTVYIGRMEFLNENETPIEDVTLEVLEEGEEHQVFYLAESSLNVEFEYLDADANGNPIGVDFRLTTRGASTGNLTFILIHEGNKSADGASEGIYNEGLVGGDTDIEVTFDVSIQ